MTLCWTATPFIPFWMLFSKMHLPPIGLMVPCDVVAGGGTPVLSGGCCGYAESVSPHGWRRPRQIGPPHPLPTPLGILDLDYGGGLNLRIWEYGENGGRLLALAKG